MNTRKVSKGAKIRNRYNQVPHMTQKSIKVKQPILTSSVRRNYYKHKYILYHLK